MELDSVPSEDEIGGYIPLERPSCSSMNVVQEPPRQPIVYSDDEVNQESSSDDSDDARIVKNSLKRKIPPKPAMATSDVSKKKKFQVWSDILQNEAMENEFNDSKFFGGSRGNETYNYRMKYFINGNDNEACGDSQENDNSKNNDFSDVKSRPWAKRRKFNKKLKLGALDVTVDDSEENVALDIAKKLNEPKTDLIEKIVTALGKQKSIEVFNKTREIEQGGGYLTLDKSRRRTSGGVFLKLVKSSKLSRKQFDAIFKYNDNFGQKYSKPNKQKEKKKMSVDESESGKEDDYKDLPTRAELELSLSIEDNERNVLKNPPPSPVYPSPSQNANSCPLSDLFPKGTEWPQPDAFNSDSNPGTWSPKHSFDSDSASKNPSAPPGSPSCSPHSPTYSPTSPVNILNPSDT